MIEGRLDEVVLITGFLIIKATQPEGSKTFDWVELAKTIFDTCVVYSISKIELWWEPVVDFVL